MYNILKYKHIFGILVLSFALFSADVAAFGETDIRIAIAHDATSCDFRGTLSISVPGIEGRGSKKITAKRAIITASPTGFNINSDHITSETLSITSKLETIKYKGSSYHGEVRLHRMPGRKILVVNTLPLEEYLVGLVTSEMPADWHAEALKAQSVVARTYALFQKKMHASNSNPLYDLEATTMDQVYKGGRSDDFRIRKIVSSTDSEILESRGKLIKAFFHSSCGGKTETALNVWGEKNKFVFVDDPYCKDSPHNSWTYSTTKEALANKIRKNRYPAKTIEKIEIDRIDGNPRAATVILGTGGQTIYIQGNDFRRMVGYRELKSTWFDVTINGSKITFTGRGFGHGVGMCQWGARGMAEAGKSYRDILHFYYPGARIAKQ